MYGAFFTQFDNFVPRLSVAFVTNMSSWGEVIPQVIWPLPLLQAWERSPTKVITENTSTSGLGHQNAAQDKNCVVTKSQKSC